MTDVIGRGIIEVVTDGAKASAGISDVKTALQTLKDTAKAAGESLTSSSTAYLRALEKQATAIEKQAATFGKTKAEIASYNAAQLGISTTSASMVARIQEAEKALSAQKTAAKEAAAETLRLSAAQQEAATRSVAGGRALDSIRAAAQSKQRDDYLARQRDAEAAAANRAAAAEKALANIRTAAQQSQKEAFASQTTFIARLQSEADAVGKSRSEMLALQAAKLGVTQQAAPLIARLAATEGGLQGVAKGAKLAAFQQQQLGFQLHDFFVQVQAGQSPLTAFIQQGSQLSGTFGGAGGAFRAVMGLLTPLRVALGGTAAAVGALGLAWYEGQKQSKAFADAITLSGNFAGQTEGSFNALAKSVAASTRATVGDVREFQQALVATGEIGPQVFSAATTAAVGYAKATGKTAAEVAKDFADMARSPTKWAAEHNRAFNDITASQYAAIKAFEENGRSADAQGVIYEALNARFVKVQQNLGTLEKVLLIGKSAWSSFWDSAFDVGRTRTIEQKIEETAEKLRAAQGAPAGETGGGAALVGPRSGRRAAVVQATLSNLQDEQMKNARQQLRELENAADQASRANAQKEAIAADTVVDGYLKRGKAVSLYKQKLDELNRSFEAKALAGVPVSDADKKVARAQLKKDFTDPKVAGEADQVRKAQLANALKTLQDELQKERDVLAFHGRYLDGVYHASEISLKDYYDERKSLADRALADQLQSLAAQRSAIEATLSKTTDPSDRITLQKQINEKVAEAELARQRASEAGVLADQERKASTKALNDQVTAYRANLLQMAGDEAGAARLRAQTAIQNAQILARQSGGQITQKNIDDEKRLAEGIIVTNQARKESGTILDRLGIAEERLALKQKSGAMGEYAALRALGEARAGIVADLEKQVVAQEAVARESENPALVINAQRARLELDKLKDSLDPLREKFDNLFKDSGASAIESFLNGTRGLRGAVDDFGKSIARSINADISKELSGKLFGEGGLLGGKGGAGGLLADLFGGKGGASAQTAAAGAIAAASATSSTALAALTTSATAAATALATIAATGGGAGVAGAASGLFGGAGSFLGGVKYGATDFTADPFAAIGFAQGTNRVPRDGMYRLHADEMVVPARFNPALAAKPAAQAQGSNGGASNDRRPITLNVNMQPQRGVTRASAMQQGADAAFAMQRALARNA